MRFYYQGRDMFGKTLTGTIIADDIESAKNLLANRGIFTTQIRERGTNRRHKRVKAMELVTLAKEMSVMVQAGVPQDKILITCERQFEQSTLGSILRDIRMDVASGIRLSDALRKHPGVFNNVFVNMVKSGEESGRMPQALHHLADFLDKQNQIRSKVVSALIYPAMISAFTVLGVVFLLVFVFPQLEYMYADLGGELPALTRIFIGISNIIREFWFLILPIIAFLALLGRKWLQSDAGIRWKDSFLLKTPLVGFMMKRIALLRFVKTLSSLLSSGANTELSIEISGKSAGNYWFEQASRELINSLKIEGTSIAKNMARNPKIFPPLIVNLVGVGEETGKISDMLDQVATYYEHDVLELTSRLNSLLDPILMIGMVVVVGFVLMALYLPIFQLNTLL